MNVLLIIIFFLCISIGHGSNIFQTWNVTENGKMCIMANFTAKIMITYKDIKNTQQNTTLDITSDAYIDANQSKCETDHDYGKQVMVLKFINDTDSNNGVFKLIFQKRNIKVIFIKISIKLTENIFPNYLDSTQYETYVDLWNNEVNIYRYFGQPFKSYYCEFNKTLMNYKSTFHFNSAQIEFNNIQLEAFMDADQNENRQFSPHEDCNIDPLDSWWIDLLTSCIFLYIIISIFYILFKKTRKISRQGYIELQMTNPNQHTSLNQNENQEQENSCFKFFICRMNNLHEFHYLYVIILLFIYFLALILGLGLTSYLIANLIKSRQFQSFAFFYYVNIFQYLLTGAIGYACFLYLSYKNLITIIYDGVFNAFKLSRIFFVLIYLIGLILVCITLISEEKYVFKLDKNLNYLEPNIFLKIKIVNSLALSYFVLYSTFNVVFLIIILDLFLEINNKIKREKLPTSLIFLKSLITEYHKCITLTESLDKIMSVFTGIYLAFGFTHTISTLTFIFNSFSNGSFDRKYIKILIEVLPFQIYSFAYYMFYAAAINQASKNTTKNLILLKHKYEISDKNDIDSTAIKEGISNMLSPSGILTIHAEITMFRLVPINYKLMFASITLILATYKVVSTYLLKLKPR